MPIMADLLTMADNNLIQDYYSSPDITNAQNEAMNAGTTAASYQSAAALLPQKLREAVLAKVDYNKDIISQQDKAQAQYFAAPSAARAKYADPNSPNYIFNPIQAENLVAQSRAQAYEPYATLTDILGQRLGSLSDIINAGTGAFQADVTAKQSAADLLRQKYNDLLTMAAQKTNLAQWDYEQKKQAAQWLYEQTHKNTGGGTTADKLSATENKIATDAKNYTNLDTLMKKYGTDPYVTPDDILRIYNTYSPWKTATETAEQLNKNYGTTQKVTQPTNETAVAYYANEVKAGNLSLSNVPADYRDEVAAVLGQSTTGGTTKPWWQFW